MATNSARWERVNELFHAAVSMMADEREAFLVRECGTDSQTRIEVQSLLAAHDAGGLVLQSLTAGTRLGDYEVTSFIAAGGMGQVYRARDTKLGREIALKILPPAFVSDPDRRARFEREARVLASLNHPNIATIYGFVEEDGISALALELVEGDTLADRIARGRIPIPEALRIAKQIAEALEAAHEQGIIHRDLKPANIKLTRDGTVKVLDFGLAKLVESAGPAFSSDVAATLTSVSVTGERVLLGTPAYMSPEQARGETADRRTDIWAFGCVVYEALSGQPAFRGEDIPRVLRNVVQQEPAWDALPSTIPERLRIVLHRCLEKAKRNRLDSAASIRMELDDLSTPQVTRHVIGPFGSRRLSAVLTLVAVLLIAVVGFVLLARRVPPATPAPVQFVIVPPEGYTLWTDYNTRNVAISPDGATIVYTVASATSGERHLAIRKLSQVDTEIMQRTTDARSPFFSPDGHWVAYFAANELRKLPIDGGASTLICKVAFSANRGSRTTTGVWSDDDTILFSTGGNSAPLQRVSAGGGEPVVVAQPEQARNELAFTSPALIAETSAVLVNVSPFGGADESVGLVDLSAKQRRVLFTGGSIPKYVDAGRLVFASPVGLQTIRFDTRTMSVVDAPTTVPTPGAVAGFDVSKNGTLVYVPGIAPVSLGNARGKPRTLVWVDRSGAESPTNAPPRAYGSLRLSPDGEEAVVDIRDNTDDVWVWNFKRQTLTRVTSDRTGGDNPVWIPGSNSVLYNSVKDGAPGVFMQRADGTGPIQRLTNTSYSQLTKDVTPDGKYLLTADQLPNGQDIGVVPLSAPARAQLLLQGVADQNNPTISPDGHWIAFDSNESGTQEVYVRPFPDVQAGRWQISNSGGRQPMWSRNGKELFYLDTNNFLVTAPIVLKPTFSVGQSKRVFERQYLNGGARSYDISPDGRRFLMIKDIERTNIGDQPTHLVVVLNWLTKIQQAAATN